MTLQTPASCQAGWHTRSDLIVDKNRKLLLAAVAFQSLFLVVQTGQVHFIAFYHERLSSEMFTLWLAGLLVFMTVPPWVALLFWRGAGRFKHGWLLDMLLFPTLWVIGWACVKVVLFAAGEPDDDGPSGWAMDPAKLLLILTIVTYFVALIFKVSRRSRAKANVG
jgi:hypothetical protein